MPACCGKPSLVLPQHLFSKFRVASCQTGYEFLLDEAQLLELLVLMHVMVGTRILRTCDDVECPGFPASERVTG